MSGFVQIIEFRTNRIGELKKAVEEVGSDTGTGAALRGTITQDRDRPGWYFNIVEFDSYGSAMSNSSQPEVGAFAARMAALCEEPPRFYNLDVVQTWSAGPSTSTKAAVATAATALAGAAATGLTKARSRIQERRSSGVRTVPTATATATATSPHVVGRAESETVTKLDTPPPPPPSAH